MSSSVQIGKYLAQLREKAGFKQNELAAKVTWSPAVLSRVESGERTVNSDELTAIVEAIGSPNALRFAETIGRNWEYLTEPFPDHPDDELLWQAESALKRIAEMSGNPDVKNVFVRRLEEYRYVLHRAAEITLGVEYSVAFVGDIGVGKSTAICRSADLEVHESTKIEPVLEAGAGGITVCEVHLVQGPQYGILVDPVSEGELRREVSEFAQYLIGRFSNGEEDNSEGSEAHGTSREIERAIRNMSGLRNERVRGEDGSRHSVDRARELAQKLDEDGRDADALAIEILARINLPHRSRHELWYPGLSTKSELRWLKDVFLEVNNGRHPEFSLPKRIQVMVPRPVLEEGSLSIRIVDTKGIDGTAERWDIEHHLNDAKTIVVLCSKFNDAPSSSVQQVLKRAVDGQFPDLQSKAAVLVLPRPDEALAMKIDTGEPAVNVEEGYELKGDQAQMILDTRGLHTAGLEFFNVREDDVENLNSFLFRLVRDLRRVHVGRLGEVISETNTLIDNFEKEQESETLRVAARQLNIWIEHNGQVSLAEVAVQESLLQAIGNAHASSVRASVRREGDWYNLDYSHQLGFGARVRAARTIRPKQKSLSAIIDNLLNDPEMEEAHGLLNQALHLLDAGVTTLLRNCQQLGVTFHTGTLQPASDLWQRCEARWGEGTGYRDAVRGYHKEWFERESERIEERFKNLVQGEWRRTLERLTSILEIE